MASRPPRDLSSLLEDIRVPEDIENLPWIKRFREHLINSGQNDKESMLDFVIVCNVLRQKEKQVKDYQNLKWRIAEVNKERRELLRMIGDSFFSESSKTPIPLSNPVLWEDLSLSLSQIDDKSEENELSSAFKLVWAAKYDHKVWKAGLEAAYNIFLTTNPRNGFQAVLLSII